MWTADGGRHWHVLRIGLRFMGNAKFLFWTPLKDRVHGGNKLYQVDPWPPRTGSAGNSRVVASLSAGHFGQLANIPGGVVAAVDGLPAVRLLIHRTGRNRLIDLAPSACPTGGEIRIGKIVVDWPEIVILTYTYTPKSFNNPWHVAFVSDDAGQSADWRALGTC
jgi:hypothetical protein